MCPALAPVHSLLAAISQHQLWPVLVLSIVLLVEAWIDLTRLKVPNKITYPTIFIGWLYALVEGARQGADVTVYLPGLGADLFDLHGATGGAVQGLWSSVGLTFYWPTWVLLAMYAIGGMGAGDVKMHMGFGAWVAAIYGWELGTVIVTWGFIFGALTGGVISAIMIWWSGSFSQNRKNVAEIVGDFLGSKGIGEVAEKAAARKPRLQLLPYGVPLCIGYLAYVALDYFNYTGWLHGAGGQ